MGGLLNLCANNYLGLADHPAVIEAARDALERWGFGMASVRFICGTQTLHKQLEERLSEFLGTERHDPVQLLLRCERRAVRGAARPRRRRHLGCAQPRLHHRRDPALQGDAAALCERRPGRARGAAPGGGRRPYADDRDGRRLLDGRPHRRPVGDLRPRRPPRCARDGGRLPCRRVRGAERPRHARAAPGHRTRRHPHRHPGQGDGRRVGRLRLRPRARSSSSCASAPGRISSPTASPRRSLPPACVRSSSSRNRRSCATGCGRTPPGSAVR